MRLVFTALLFASALNAGAQVTAAFEPQPPEVFKAVFGSNNKKITLYQVEVCNDGTSAATIHAGRIYAAAQAKGIATVSALLVGAVILGAENKSWLRLSIDLARWGAWAATVLTGSSVLSAPASFKAALPLIAEGNAAAASYLTGKVIDPGPVERQFLNGMMELAPGACSSSLMMASKVASPAALVLAIDIPEREQPVKIFVPNGVIPPASVTPDDAIMPPLHAGNF